ncbi:PorP/SprF family type IX secretion system membrane protein [Portibacter marinus]|uniref:PorP/SprF family type IX secretion system membrane protein n=1 Tax=Portibacter marinus TaxID=2898660 RepID=UPI001F15CCB9|nr:PorP/SprF family type IX secretion system membrane protein [Portibacter marinus]
MNRFLFLLLIISSSAIAQQPMQFSQFMFNKYQMNPAYAGFEYSLNVTGVYRSQWNELPTQPRTQNVNAHLPMYILNGALGINVANEQIGYFNNTLGTISYNYVLETTLGLFSGGLKAGLMQSALSGSLLRTPSGIYEDPTISHQDPILSELNESGVGVLYGAGVYFIGNFFEAGLSISTFPSTSISISDTKVELIPYINFYGESNIDLNDNLIVAPSIMVRSDLVQTQIDVAAIAKLSGNIFGGLGVRGYNSRTLDAAIVYAGWRFNEHYTLSYAYDIGVSALRSVHDGTHEILLNYNLNKLIGAGLPPKIIYNPRYL